MVTIEQDESRNTSLILEPNRSLTPEMSKVLWVGVLLPAVFTSVLFTVIGAWLVLPFIVAETALLLCIVYWVKMRSMAREELLISVDRVAVRKQCGGHARVWVFTRAHLSLLLGVDEHLTPRHLTLCGDDGLVEVGDFLTADELHYVLRHLRQSGLSTRCNLQWCLLNG